MLQETYSLSVLLYAATALTLRLKQLDAGIMFFERFLAIDVVNQLRMLFMV